ncbi:MAG: hypothetical protein QW780_02140 [Sulfolobales archaeon]
MRRRILIKGGLSHLLDLYTQFKLKILSYNEKIKSTGYYVKPIHVTYKNSCGVKLKYVYFGRYWYRLSKRKERITWVYVGKEKPDPSLPDPPLNPFEGVSVIVLNDEDIEVEVETLQLLARIEQSIGQPGVFTKLLAENLSESESR